MMNTEVRVREFLAKATVLDVTKARYTPDPYVDGVWLAEFDCGTKLIVYLFDEDFEEVD